MQKKENYCMIKESRRKVEDMNKNNKNKNKGFIATAVLYSLVALILIVIFIILRNFQTIRNIERDDSAKIKGQVLYYEVYFNGNEATGGRMSKQRISSGRSEPLAANQYTKTGYKFIGWKKTPDGDCIIDGSNKNCYQDKESVYNLTTTGKRITLYAHWVPETATVTFDANGGSAPSFSSKVVTYKQQYGNLPTTSKYGHSYGWYTAKEGGTRVDNTTKVTIRGNHTLYAHWWKTTYSIYFDPNGGEFSSDGYKYSRSLGTITHTQSDSVTTRLGDKVTALPEVKKQKYIFQGWYTAKDGGTKIDLNYRMQNQGYTFYAHWSPDPNWPRYQITFDPNGGSVNPTSKMVDKDDAYYGELPTPTWEYRTFLGWYTEREDGKGTRITATSSFDNQAHTLYAHWRDNNTYKVVYNRGAGDSKRPNGTAIPDMSPSYFTVGSTSYLSSNTYSKYGYSFTGWSKNNDTSKACNAKQTNQSKGDFCFGNRGSVKDLATAHNSITLYAKWTPVKYNVTYDANGGKFSSGTTKVKEVTFGKAYAPPTTNPTATGKAFLGWYFDKYTPKYQLQTTENIGNEQDKTKKVTTKTYVSKDAAHTLYARWDEKDYKVTLNANGGNKLSPNVITVTYTEPYGNNPEYQTLPTPTREGYTFLGWYTEKAADKGTRITASTTMNTAKAHTLYAHWTINMYRITFNPNGGTNPSPSYTNVAHGKKYGYTGQKNSAGNEILQDLPTNTKRAGKAFQGWFTAASGGELIKKNTTIIKNENHSVYAHWADVNADGVKIVYSPGYNINLIPHWSTSGRDNAKITGEYKSLSTKLEFSARRDDGNGAGIQGHSNYVTTDGFTYINVILNGRKYSSDLYVNSISTSNKITPEACSAGTSKMYYSKAISGDKIRLAVDVYSGYDSGGCNGGVGGLDIYKVVLSNRKLSKAEMDKY